MWILLASEIFACHPCKTNIIEIIAVKGVAIEFS